MSSLFFTMQSFLLAILVVCSVGADWKREDTSIGFEALPLPSSVSITPSLLSSHYDHRYWHTADCNTWKICVYTDYYTTAAVLESTSNCFPLCQLMNSPQPPPQGVGTDATVAFNFKPFTLELKSVGIYDVVLSLGGLDPALTVSSARKSFQVSLNHQLPHPLQLEPMIITAHIARGKKFAIIMADQADMTTRMSLLSYGIATASLLKREVVVCWSEGTTGIPPWSKLFENQMSVINSKHDLHLIKAMGVGITLLESQHFMSSDYQVKVAAADIVVIAANEGPLPFIGCEYYLNGKRALLSQLKPSLIVKSIVDRVSGPLHPCIRGSSSDLCVGVILSMHHQHSTDDKWNSNAEGRDNYYTYLRMVSRMMRSIVRYRVDRHVTFIVSILDEARAECSHIFQGLHVVYSRSQEDGMDISRAYYDVAEMFLSMYASLVIGPRDSSLMELAAATHSHAPVIVLRPSSQGTLYVDQYLSIQGCEMGLRHCCGRSCVRALHGLASCSSIHRKFGLEGVYGRPSDPLCRDSITDDVEMYPLDNSIIVKSFDSEEVIYHLIIPSHLPDGFLTTLRVQRLEKSEIKIENHHRGRKLKYFGTTSIADSFMFIRDSYENASSPPVSTVTVTDLLPSKADLTPMEDVDYATSSSYYDALQSHLESQSRKVKVLHIGTINYKVDGYRESFIKLATYTKVHFPSVEHYIYQQHCGLGEEYTPILKRYEELNITVVSECVMFPSDVNTEEMPSILGTLRSTHRLEEVHTTVRQVFQNVIRVFSQYDAVVISNGAKGADDYLIEIARLAGVAVRVMDLGPIGPSLMFDNAMSKSLTAYFSPSNFVKRESLQVDPETASYVVYPIVDDEKISNFQSSSSNHPRPTLREQFSIDDGTVLVGFGGRLTEAKGVTFFVRAASIIASLLTDESNKTCSDTLCGHDRVKFIMIGSGPAEDAVKLLAAQLKVAIIFTGEVSPRAMPHYLHMVDILVFPSIYPEAFGMVSIESMMLSKPLVTFGIGGSGEYSIHMETAIVVDEWTPSGLAQGIMILIDNEDLRVEIGRKASLFANQWFRARNTASRYNYHLLSLLEKVKGGRSVPVHGVNHHVSEQTTKTINSEL